MSVRKRDYNAIDWSQYYYYDSTSPSGLRWKIKPHKCTPITAGSVAGSKCGEFGRYWRVKSGNVPYLVHNIIYILTVGFLPDEHVVDHIDGNGLNNIMSNLRAIPHRHNKHNHKKSRLNTSGVVGVNYHRGTDSWFGRVCNNGIRYIKAYPCKKHGSDAAKQMAIDFVINKRLELNATGEAAFTDRHIGIDTSINSSSKQESTLDALFED